MVGPKLTGKEGNQNGLAGQGFQEEQEASIHVEGSYGTKVNFLSLDFYIYLDIFTELSTSPDLLCQASKHWLSKAYVWEHSPKKSNFSLPGRITACFSSL